jgi:hypothetical protein
MIIMKQLLDFFSPKHYGRHLPESIPDNIKDVVSQPFLLFKVTFLIITTLFLLITLLPGWCFFFLGLIALPIVLVLPIFYILFLTILISIAITNRKYRLLILQKILVLLLNIPITIIYLYTIKLIHILLTS